MSWTVLRVVEAGVVLRDGHRSRLAATAASRHKFDAFAAEAEPGVYAISTVGGEWRVMPRSGSMMRDGLPVRYAASPLSGRVGLVDKPAAPSPFDLVRDPAWCTVLTDDSGQRLFECCVAGLVGWSDGRFVLPPIDAPRIRSVSEAAIRAHLDWSERPLWRDETAPLGAVNAVAGLCRPRFDGRDPLPDAACATIARLFDSLTGR